MSDFNLKKIVDRIIIIVCSAMVLFGTGFLIGEHYGKKSVERQTKPVPQIYHEQSIPEIAPYPIDQTVSTDEPSMESFNAESIYWLAKNIYFEARNESEAGQIAVAYTTLERVKSRHYPNTIKGVVTQAKKYNGQVIRDACQFSWFCDGKPDVIKNRKSWDRAMMIATKVIIDQPSSPAQGTTHYHASYVDPYWASSLRRVAKVDTHIFYR